MNNIKKFRTEKNITFEELAEITGISAGYLCHLEKGTRKNPTLNIMTAISTALNKTLEEIFCFK